MKSRAQWQAEQERLLASYDEVREELERIPGVVQVGIGLRHRADALVEEAVYVVKVREKKPANALSAAELVPPIIRGFPTDVVVYREPKLLLGFGDEEDMKNYKTKVGGIACNSDGSGGVGTLGCFCLLNSDITTVLLSCHHVLFDGEAKVGSGVGQPEHSDSWCCTCNEIGKVLKGDTTLDCAIASLNSDVPFFPKIRRIKKSDGSVEEEGLIKGTADPVMMQEVYKVGHKTGLTRGKVTFIAPDVEIDVDSAFTRFCAKGDSGSVIIEKATGNVVGLLREQIGGGIIGVATKITAVEAAMNITVLVSDPTAAYTERMWDEEEESEFALPPTSPFEALVDRLRHSEAGRGMLELFDRHKDECRALVHARRTFTVAWHRNHGPAWLAALGRSAREPIYRIPNEIEGIPRDVAIHKIATALRAEASLRLREDLDAMLEPLGGALAAADTVDAWCQLIESQHSHT